MIYFFGHKLSLNTINTEAFGISSRKGKPRFGSQRKYTILCPWIYKWFSEWDRCPLKRNLHSI